MVIPLTDHLLLAPLGLLNLIPGSALYYKYRPNTKRVFIYNTQRFIAQLLSTKSFGWLNDEFSAQKPSR